MEELYHVSGCLNEGFVGQISYTICLDQEYDALDIHFTFDKQHFTEVTEETRASITKLCADKYGITDYPEEQVDELILHEAKTEIHTMATLNDTFIGCVHRQLTDRHMLYEDGKATDGCIPQESFAGVLKVTVLVFNVILDDTHYTLSVHANPKKA